MPGQFFACSLLPESDPGTWRSFSLLWGKSVAQQFFSETVPSGSNHFLFSINTDVII